MRLFVYGTLKPDHPGFTEFFDRQEFRIATFPKAQLSGYKLLDWDGLAVAAPSSDATWKVINGFLLEVIAPEEKEALKLLDLYEIGDGDRPEDTYPRPLERKEVEVECDGTKVKAWAYVLSERRAKQTVERTITHEIETGHWTMADDRLYRTIFPLAALELRESLGEEDRELGHVKTLGMYLVIYSCLERFGLHVFGPRRFREGDRDALQKLLKDRYFKTERSESRTASPTWFQVHEGFAKLKVHDSTSMNSCMIGKAPTTFWAMVRNNTAHQGKDSSEEHRNLVRVAAASLTDFLVMALTSHNREIGESLRASWEKYGLRVIPGQFQESLNLSDA